MDPNDFFNHSGVPFQQMPDPCARCRRGVCRCAPIPVSHNGSMFQNPWPAAAAAAAAAPRTMPSVPIYNEFYMPSVPNVQLQAFEFPQGPFLEQQPHQDLPASTHSSFDQSQPDISPYGSREHGSEYVHLPSYDATPLEMPTAQNHVQQNLNFDANPADPGYFVNDFVPANHPVDELIRTSYDMTGQGYSDMMPGHLTPRRRSTSSSTRSLQSPRRVRKKSKRHVSFENDNKRRENLRRNREAASKCRNKKKQSDELKVQHEAMLRQQNHELKNEFEKTSAELRGLKEMLLDHIMHPGCTCTGIQQYFHKLGMAVLKRKPEEIPDLDDLMSYKWRHPRSAEVGVSEPIPEDDWMDDDTPDDAPQDE